MIRKRGEKPQREELLDVYHQTLSMLKTGEYFGVSKRTVINWMNYYEIPRFSRKIRKTLQEPVRRYIKQGGYTTREVANLLGVSDVTINKVCRDIGKAKAFDKYHNGYIITYSNYKMFHKPTHPLADSKGYVREHRLVMEDYLGRYLDREEIVHHIDEDTLNNNISNLELCNKEAHNKYHHSKDIV